MVSVDFAGLLPHSLLALLDTTFFQTLLDDIASAARAKWIRLAQDELGSSKRDYIDGIQNVEGTGNTRTIALVGFLANAVEEGIDGYDLRETLLNQNAKRSKSGARYRSIPFRHGTPGSSGQAGTPMGARYGPQGGSSLGHAAEGRMQHGQAAALGKAIYRRAQRLKAGQRLGGGGGTTLGRGKAMIQVPKLAPWHKTDLFAGMQRDKNATGRGSQYKTFRTISDEVKEGWIHPGIQGRHLVQHVEDHIREILGTTIEAALRGAVGS